MARRSHFIDEVSICGGVRALLCDVGEGCVVSGAGELERVHVVAEMCDFSIAQGDEPDVAELAWGVVGDGVAAFEAAGTAFGSERELVDGVRGVDFHPPVDVSGSEGFDGLGEPWGRVDVGMVVPRLKKCKCDRHLMSRRRVAMHDADG
jgi:hypothetical protein